MWGSRLKRDINKVLKLQERSVHVILNVSDITTPPEPLFKKTNVMQFTYLVKHRMALMVFKCLASDHLKGILTLITKIHLSNKECNYSRK